MLFNWFMNALMILVAAYLLPGVHVQSFLTALVAAIVLGILNTIVKPILILFTLPLTILTLGLFTFVINAVVIMLATFIVPGFRVDSFGWALLFSLVLSLINSFLQRSRE